MRPIKFRAWDGKMVYGVLAGGNTECPNVCDYDMDSVWWWHEPPEAIMQFTGLCDRNGKEVWEGDVVRYTNNDGIKRVGFVEWFEEEACFYLNSLPLWEQTEKEVIGNIYQNPELLEEK